jgi:hypothetical protein
MCVNSEIVGVANQPEKRAKIVRRKQRNEEQLWQIEPFRAVALHRSVAFMSPASSGIQYYQHQFLV